jgi:hypothetical protein
MSKSQRRLIHLLLGLLLALMVSACGDTGAGAPPAEEPTIEAPADVVEVTPTEEAAEEMTETESITGTEEMTGSEEMTGAEDAAGTEDMTDTVGITDTLEITGTATVTE